MTVPGTAASRQAVVDAALVLLEQMGLTPADLAAVPQHRPEVPTFAEYVPIASAAVSAGTRRAYGSYWNRIVGQWGDRRLDEIAPSEIRQLMAYVIDSGRWDEALAAAAEASDIAAAYKMETVAGSGAGWLTPAISGQHGEGWLPPRRGWVTVS